MKRKMTLSVEDAQELAKAQSIPGLEEAIAVAVEAGWHALELVAEATDDGYDLSVLPPSGVMVAWFLPSYLASEIAFPGGEWARDLHITLGYFGDASAMSLDDQRKLIGIVGEVTERHAALTGSLEGTGRFVNGEDTDPFWVGVNIPGLDALRADLIQTCREAGIEPAGKGGDDYKPHVTVAYIPKEQELPPLDFARVDVDVRGLTVCLGEQRIGPVELRQQDEGYPDPRAHGWTPTVMTKAIEVEEEQRFTLAPWYVPDQVDAHNEWTDTSEAQKALWGYVKKDDRRIRLQHNTDIVAGEWVEAMTWPFEVTVPLTKSDGTATSYTYPAGTPFLGVQWNEWAWELIKAGKLSGYSIGGSSNRIEVDLGAGDVEVAEESLTKALGDCDEWTGAKDKNGYGMRTVGGKTVMAHRHAFTESGGKLGKDEEVRHKCNNSSCVKPSHLHAGTHQQNIDDKKKG